MKHFRYDDYQKKKVELIPTYIQNTTAYLKRRYPHVPVADIVTFVKNEVETQLVKPQVKMVVHKSYGNAELASVDLLDITKQFNDNIITPAGVMYMKVSKKKSFLTAKISDNLKFRKTQKKRMLEAAAREDTVTEQIANYLQSSIKIETNSIPGAKGSPYNPLFDIPGYNAVTAIPRHSIMCGYAHVEKLVAGNLYFPDLEHVINYCIIHCRICPKNVMEVIHKYKLHIPTINDITEHFKQSMSSYSILTNEIISGLFDLVSCLSEAERCFIFYANCAKTLITKNEVFFRKFLSQFFNTDIPVDLSVDVNDLFKYNSDLVSIVTSLNADVIHRVPVSDAKTTYPSEFKKLISIAKHMTDMMDTTSDIWSTFMKVDCDVQDAMSHPNMIRKAVIVSDTDSVLFSTQHWITWYTNKDMSFDKSAYEINTFIVFLVVMTLEQLFARLSTSFGAEGDNRFLISMKNEFMYPLMLRTPVPKQYAGKVAIQEGFVLPKLKDDIKGLAFRSSSFCKETARAGDEFRNYIFDKIMKGEQLLASDCINKVLDYEKKIRESLLAGEKTYLTTKPIKFKDEYKDAGMSAYYYWELWDQVFKPNFGEFVIPNKGYVIPLLNDGKILNNKEYLDTVEAFDPQLKERLLKFIETNKRTITFIYIPMTLKRIPEILRPTIDVRSIIYSNTTPFVATLKSLGLAYTDSHNKMLLSDIYG